MAHPFEDDIQSLEPKEARPIPVGWSVLFWGLVLFGAFYLWAYTPFLGGWSQEKELAQSAGQTVGMAVNIFATILFTALATLAAIAIVWSLARGRKAR